MYKYKLIDDEKQKTETDDLQIEEENSLMNHVNMLHVRNALNINLSHLSAFDAYATHSHLHWNKSNNNNSQNEQQPTQHT